MEGGEEVTFELSEGTEYVMDEGQVQVVELGDAGITEEVEVVTVETSSAPASSVSKRMKLVPSTSSGLQGLDPLDVSSTRRGRRSGTGPALLRNSRKAQQQNQSQEQQMHYLGSQLAASKQKTSLPSSGYQHAVLLDEHGQPTDEVVVLAPTGTNGEFSIIHQQKNPNGRPGGDGVDYLPLTNLDRSDDGNAGNSSGGQPQETIFICQDADGNQFLDTDGNLIHMDGGVPFNVEDGATIFLDGNSFGDGGASFIISHGGEPSGSKKKKSNKKKPVQVIIGPDGTPVKKKGQVELKCMEKGCTVVSCNVGELRKHLTLLHGMHFDEETVMFESDTEFKSWRENYERERMVSFIYRGGTKKVAKDQAVTYLICHRSGHYKPTMGNDIQRKRKLKPQGSCKMGGYCTAGIKLSKNIETGLVKMEICHTHYGHPLDSDAIPHLRVTPTLRKVILSKFKEGMSFTDVLAYIHHNPDRLEGLRLVDRRAVRNIYDTWKHPTRRSKLVQKDIDELNDLPPEEITRPFRKAKSEQLNYILDTDEQQEENENFQTTPEEPVPEVDPIELPEELEQIKSQPPKKRPRLLSVVDDGIDTEKVEVPLSPAKEKTIPKLVAVCVDKQPEASRSLRSGKKVDSEREPPKLTKQPKPSSSTAKPIEDPVPIIIATRSYGLRPNRKVEVYGKPDSAGGKGKKGNATKEGEQNAVPSVSKKKKKQQVVENNDDTTLLSLQQIKEEYIASDDDDGSPITINDCLDQSVSKLITHGDSGPSVLLYKPLNSPIRAGMEHRKELKRGDFCVVLQTPVQRQLLQMFPNVVGFDIIDTMKGKRKHLKLGFLMVLDEFREPIPVAWLVANSIEPRILSAFFKCLRKESGDLPTKYLMTPINCPEIYDAWCTTFTQNPAPLLNDIDVKRELKGLVWTEFSTERGRKEVWEVLESLITERNAENLDISYLDEKFEPLLDKFSHTGEFIEKLEKDWLSIVTEWARCFRFTCSVNLFGVSFSFNKLRKFIHFKGTKNLDENFEHILKIGYDKCFLRSKRMFKGDQKFTKYLDHLALLHRKGRDLMDITVTQESDDCWTLNILDNEIYTIYDVNSPCDCKLICRLCKICQHVYTCSCSAFVNNGTMCPHIHYLHCYRKGISEDPDMITGDIVQAEDATSSPSFGKIDGGEGAVINIDAVLKAAGLFGREDGLQPDQIVSITDADTHTIIYENSGGGEDSKGQHQEVIQVVQVEDHQALEEVNTSSMGHNLEIVEENENNSEVEIEYK